MSASRDLAGSKTASDLSLLARLRAGDELALAELVKRHHRFLLRLALRLLRNQASAEDVVQETWMVVLKAIARFQGRSSVKTWIYRILIRRAQTRLSRESRSVPFSALQPTRLKRHESIDSSWTTPLPSDKKDPEERLIESETMGCLNLALQRLPTGLRTVVTLRDIEGFDSGEVRSRLGLSETNQRVRLHRGRLQLRTALRRHLAEAA